MFHDLQLKAVLTYIENRMTEPISLRALSEMTGYSPDHLRHVFMQHTGESLARYIRKRRLSHAAFALMHTGRSIVDIALSAGFASHDAFTRAFRTAFGLSPSAFRTSGRIVKGVPIIPGMYAPTVIQKEDFWMNTVPSEGNVVLYGVPKVTYFSDPPQLTPFLSCLHACLTYAGQPIRYARLMAASGAAFRLMWNTEYLDGGNVDILVMRPDPMEPIARAFAAAGRSYTHVQRADTPSNHADMLTLIRQEIDAGRPLIAFGVIGPPEACVITGYQNMGESLLGWNFFQDFPEWQGSLSVDASGYFVRKDWYEHPMTLGMIAVGEPGPLPEERAALKTIVDFAIDVLHAQRVGERAGSASAYDAWASMLEDDAQFSSQASLPQLLERTMCQMDAFTMVAEGRWCAEDFFEEAAKNLPALSGPLHKVSAAFQTIRACAHHMIPHMGGLGMGEQQARTLAKKENRTAVARIVRQCKELELRALDALVQLAQQL